MEQWPSSAALHIVNGVIRRCIKPTREAAQRVRFTGALQQASENDQPALMTAKAYRGSSFSSFMISREGTRPQVVGAEALFA